MSTTTLEFTLPNHRRAALERVVAACAGTDPVRADLARAALTRLDTGLYGYCVRCGIKIPEKELERRPERFGCSDCQPD